MFGLAVLIFCKQGPLDLQDVILFLTYFSGLLYCLIQEIAKAVDSLIGFGSNLAGESQGFPRILEFKIILKKIE